MDVQYNKDEFIYLEGEHVSFIYFLVKGEAAFVLPRFDNAIYIMIGQGDNFGVIDMLPYEEVNGRVQEV
jgi:CRP-like cAMP-binding protein